MHFYMLPYKIRSRRMFKGKKCKTDAMNCRIATSSEGFNEVWKDIPFYATIKSIHLSKINNKTLPKHNYKILQIGWRGSTSRRKSSISLIFTCRHFHIDQDDNNSCSKSGKNLSSLYKLMINHRLTERSLQGGLSIVHTVTTL